MRGILFGMSVAFFVVLSLFIATGTGAATIEEMLEAKSLVSAYNPELLDYLLEEGNDVLPPDQRQTALDQLVSSLRQDVEITPEE